MDGKANIKFYLYLYTDYNTFQLCQHCKTADETGLELTDWNIEARERESEREREREKLGKLTLNGLCVCVTG